MDDKSQVKIKFFTNEEDESLQVDESPLYVPIGLKRYGLSEIVNHLLGNSNDDDESDNKSIVPFDFLIDGKLLRTSLEDYLIKNGLSSETFLNLEYTRAVLPPSYLASFNNNDWISSIDSIKFPGNSKILSGSYDGIVRIYNMSGTVEKQFTGHSGSIRDTKWISPTRLVSSGNDRQIRLWKNKEGTGEQDQPQEADEDDEEPEEGTTIAILEGHKGPVVSLSVDQKTSRILSAGYDGDIGFWSTNHKEMSNIQPMEYDSNVLSSSSKKRRKMAVQDATLRRRSPLSILQSHKQPVEDLCFDKNDSTVGYSVSQDHSIKTWDLVTSRCVDTRSTGYALLSILQIPSKNLLISGSSARHINIHDPRIDRQGTDLINEKLVGHSNFVVGLTECPYNDNMFALASHDGLVKVWDVRANKPLYTITREDQTTKNSKIFDVHWDADIGIISGGLDKKLQINKGSNII